MAANLGVHAYDTLSIARNLQEDFSFNEKQAEGIARTIHQHLVRNVATKDDLANLGTELRAEMSELRAEVRGEMSKVRGEISEVRGEISEVRGEISEVRGEISELRGEISDLRGEVRSEISDLRAETRGEISDLRAEIANIHNKIDNLNKSLTIRMGTMMACSVGVLAALLTIIS